MRAETKPATNIRDGLVGEVLVVHGGRRGGGSLCAFEMARALQGLGPAFSILADGDEHLDLWSQQGLTFRTLPTYSSIATFGWHSLLGLRPRLWGEAISNCGRKFVLEAMLSPWSARFRRWSDPRLRWIPVIHDADLHPGLTRPWIQHLYEKINQTSFALAAMSKFCAEILISRWGVRPERVLQIRHGILQRPQVRLDPRERARLRLRLLFFGRIEPYKGLEFLVKAFRMAKSSCPELTLTIAGRGRLGKLKRDIDGVSGINCLNRYLSEGEVADLFSTHGVCVLPYTQATQSGVVAMALGHGVPTIASRVGGLPEQVLDGVTGLLTSPGNAAELAHAFLTIAGSEDAAANMAAATADFADREFTWGAIMRDFLAQLQRILEDPREPEKP
jgi:glycosyltransferase involved in cell wall biosynthesis